MGITGNAKKYTISLCPGAFFVREKAGSLALPRCVIIDFTYVVTYLSKDCFSGEDFIKKQVLPQFEKYFANRAQIVILVFDRHSPINKCEEHELRYGKEGAPKPKAIPLETPKELEDLFWIISDGSQDNLARHINDSLWLVPPEDKLLRRGDYPAHYTMEEIRRIEANELDERWKRARENAVERYASGDPAASLVLTDLVCPTPENWSRSMANPQLKREIFHYITCKLINDPLSENVVYSSGVYRRSSSARDQRSLPHGYIPQEGRVLCVHGGMSSKPERFLSLSFDRSLVRDDFLIAITSKTDEMGRRNLVHRSVEKADQAFPRSVLKNLGEGEVACAYYSLAHVSSDQLLVTGDGDLMLIALLASRFRLQPDEVNFKNKVWLLLKVPNPNTNCSNRVESEDGLPPSKSGDLYIDINALHDAIKYKSPYKEFSDPIATYAAVVCLMGTDYVKRFAPGLTSGTGTIGDDKKGDSKKVPWFAMPLMDNPGKYKNMIKIVGLSSSEGVPWMSIPENEAEIAARTTFDSKTRVRSDDGDDEDDDAGDFDPESGSFEYGEGWHVKRARKPRGQVILEEEIRNEFRQFKVVIDEEAFIEYTHECYCYKWGGTAAMNKLVEKKKAERSGMRVTKGRGTKKATVATKNKKPDEDEVPFPEDSSLENISFVDYSKNVETNVRKRKREHDEEVALRVECIRERFAGSVTNALMNDNEIVAHSRRLKWLLSYWINGYTGNCTYPNPCETYRGKSYYGWERCTDNYNACRSTNVVSEEKTAEAFRRKIDKDSSRRHPQQQQQQRQQRQQKTPTEELNAPLKKRKLHSQNEAQKIADEGAEDDQRSAEKRKLLINLLADPINDGYDDAGILDDLIASQNFDLF
jgi:hypothetical protein